MQAGQEKKIFGSACHFLTLFRKASGIAEQREVFEKTLKKVLTEYDIFAIIIFVAPQGSNKAANAARLQKSQKLNNFKKKKNQVIPS